MLKKGIQIHIIIFTFLGDALLTLSGGLGLFGGVSSSKDI